ncbi:MAG: hypothetical protein M1352_00930 [Patescibacteria group bacterium]|nr:hypothetical protein [Patescibacteria group bacterium]
MVRPRSPYTPKTEVPVPNQTPAATPTPTQSPLSTPSASTLTDETANWKTYINNDYGFTFKYPSSWKLEKRSDPTFNNFAQINTKDVVQIAIADPSPNLYFIDFTVYRYLGLTPKQIVDSFSTSSTAKMMKSAGVFKRNSLIINGESAEAHREYCQAGYCWLINIRSVKRALMAEIFVQTRAEDINQIENSIISTFKFL